MTHVRSHVAQLEGDLRQGHQLATEKISAETSLKQQFELLMQEVAALKVRARSPASGSTEMAFGASRQVRIGVDVRFDRGGRQETPPSECRSYTLKRCKSVGAMTVSRDAKYGLRAVRVGEASHPGPGSRRRRTQRLRALQRSMDCADESELETESLVCVPVSVDAAQEEHAVPSTVPASSGVLRVAGHVEVIPMFDGSVDGSEREVEAVPVGRWRLVLVSQGSRVSQLG